MSQLFIRAFPTTLEIADPRQLTGRLVPYNVIADVADELPGGKHDVYREGFRPGAFAPQVNTRGKGVVSRIGFVHSHTGGLGYLGPFVALREKPDGLYGDVRIMPTKVDDVAALLESGVDELSVEFRLPSKGGSNTEVDEAGVRWRVRAHLDQVALEAKGAYSTAQVLAFRSEVDDEQREEAEAAAAAEAEETARLLAEAEETAEKERAAKELEEGMERKRRWDELAGRVDSELAKGEKLHRDYGVTRTGYGASRH